MNKMTEKDISKKVVFEGKIQVLPGLRSITSDEMSNQTLFGDYLAEKILHEKGYTIYDKFKYKIILEKEE